MKPIILIVILFFATHLSADAFKDYKRSCQVCHKEPALGAKLKESREWGVLFDNDAKLLRQRHANIPEAMEHLDSRYFKRHMRTLRNFLMENASDTGGIIRSCDGSGNRC